MNPPLPNPTGYAGNVATIALGKAGLFTDAAQCDIPQSGLIRANNVTFYNQVLQKDYGSRIWNDSALPAGVVRATEMYPDSQSQNQRIFALCRNGQLYKFLNHHTQVQITPEGDAPDLLFTGGYTSLVVGGNELVSRDKKLFVLNGHNLPQIVSGDGTTRADISKPAADWTGTQQPFGGIVHRGAMYCWGNANNPHGIYASSVIDQEDFQTNGQFYLYNVYPGDSDGIVCGAVFRGRLWALKYPVGLYYLVDTDSNRANWYFTKHSDDYGAASPQAATVALNDLFIGNNYTSVTSLLASLVYGDVLASDIFHTQNCYRFAEEQVRVQAPHVRSVVYYAKKKQLLVTFQSNQGVNADRIAIIDFKNPQNVPKVSWSTKDQANCLFLVRNAQKIAKPFYGSEDGNLYEMDVPDKWVGVGGSDTTQTLQYGQFSSLTSLTFGTVAMNPDWNTKWSMSLWFNFASTANFLECTNLSGDRGFNLDLDPAQTTQLAYFGHDATNLIRVYFETQQLLGSWRNVVWTYDGSGLASGLSLYIDGISQVRTVDTDNLGGLTTVSPNPTSLGGAAVLDEFGMYDRTLTPAQAAEIAAAGRGYRLSQLGSAAALTHYYPLNGNADDSVGSINGAATNLVYLTETVTLQNGYLFDAQTPHMDLSQENLQLASQVKTFDFLEVQYEPTGDFDCSIDLYIDQRFVKTYACNLSARSNLNELPLNSSVVDGLGTMFRRFPINGDGRTISLRFRNSGLGQDVRLVRAYIYYRVSGQQQTISK